MDTHDLVIKSTKVGSKPIRFKKLDPRAHAEERAPDPRPLCAVVLAPDHKARGMHATLVVTQVVAQAPVATWRYTLPWPRFPTTAANSGNPKLSASSGEPGSGRAEGRRRASPASVSTAPSVLTHPPGESGSAPPTRRKVAARARRRVRPRPPRWLDRMVRTRRPLVERMTLVWHDWFATSNAGVGSQKLMLAQNRLLRRHALGSFDTSSSRSRPIRPC